MATTEESASGPKSTGFLSTSLLLTSLWLGTLLVAIDTTIISVAIPRISSDFKALDQIAWYGSTYL